MPKTVQVTCGACGNDLTRSGNIEDFLLALVNEGIPCAGGVVTDVGAYPAIERNEYFCGVDCLREWLDANYPAEKAPYYGGKMGAAYQRKQRRRTEQ